VSDDRFDFQPESEPPKKRRTVSPTVTVLAVLAALVAVVLLLRWGLKTGRVPCGPALPCAESLYVAGDTMRQGELFSTMLGRLGISRGQMNQAYTALHETDFNFRRLRPGDSVTFRYRGFRLVGLSYHKDLAHRYDVRFDSIGAVAVKKLLPVDTVRAVVAGRVRESIWHSLTRLGERGWLVMTFTDILRYDVDFFTESSDGDSFQLVFDRLYVDTVFYKYGRVHAVHYRGRTDNTWGFFYRDPRGHWDYYNERGQSLRKTVLRSPLEFAKITSHFGMRFHPIRKIRCKHHGVDYAAPRGTPVSAVADGVVTIAGWVGGYGKLVEIRHKGVLSSRYGHLRAYGSGVKQGRRVRQGQTIGYVGSTGMSTGPHLHFEIRRNGSPVNPLKVIPPRADPVPKKYRSEFDRVMAVYRAEAESAIRPADVRSDSVAALADSAGG
jgi:hypothetical protein